MVTYTNNQVSIFVADQLPAFVREKYPLFVQFMEAYYEFMEQSNNQVQLGSLIDRANYLQTEDVDNNIDLFTQSLYNQYLHLFPQNIPSNKATLVKNIKDFYRARGSSKSAKFLFRVMFGLDIDIQYPSEFIMNLSGAKWQQDQSVIITGLTVNGVANTNLSGLQMFSNTKIEGVTSGTTAIVESVEISYENNFLVYEIFISHQEGTFSVGEQIKTTDINGNVIKANLVSRNSFSSQFNIWGYFL